MEWNQREILRYLGCTAPVPPPDLAGDVRRGCEQLSGFLRPKTVWRSLPLSGTALPGTTLVLRGRDIARHLAGCEQVILLAATLGAEVERLLMRWEVRDLAYAMVLDACASFAVEAVCDELERTLRSSFQVKGLYLTGRYSPGYGDLPLDHQREFCQILDTQRRMGLTLSPSGLMIPRKSVTAILGVADHPVTGQRAGCETCALAETCSLRKGGKTCEST